MEPENTPITDQPIITDQNQLAVCGPAPEPARRVPVYLSPTGISKYRQDPEQYYLNYAAKYAPVKDPQTQPMSIGSSFDAYVKSYLHEALFGKGHDPKFEFIAIFEAQVQPQWRDWAMLHGMYLFEIYKKCGALSDLLIELQQAVTAPKFEIEISGVINNQREPKSITIPGTLPEEGKTFAERQITTIPPLVLMGKPDVFYLNKHAAHVILDFKVNGYCSKYNKSPMPGYIKIREAKTMTYGKTAHPDAVLRMHHGVLINSGKSLHECDIDWATQLSIYAWLGGVEPGSDFIAAIDQIVCNPNGTEFPDIRIAEHRMRIDPTFQYDTLDLAQDIWHRIHSDHFFKEMTLEESQNRCMMLDTQSKDLFNIPQDFLDMTSPAKKWK